MVPAPISPPPRRWPQGLRPQDVQAPPVGVAWIVGVAMISWRGSGEGLSLLNDLLQGFAFLFCAWAVGGHMAHGDDGHGLIIGRREQVAHDGGVVVAHPAGAQPPFGCGKAQVLRGNGHIDVAMRLVVVAACSTLGCCACKRCRAGLCGTTRGRRRSTVAGEPRGCAPQPASTAGG